MHRFDVNFLAGESAVFITGTDTEIGKTHASCVLLRGLAAGGRRAVAMKPVASGCEWIEGQWQNADARALMHAAPVPAEYRWVNPFALPLATAPQIAAREAGVQIHLSVVQAAYAQLAESADFVLVEGVGGWMAPLSDDLNQADLVHALNVPVVLVVGMRLGCINHARLSVLAIQASGCRLLGWIANGVEPNFDADGAYFKALQCVMPSPCLGKIAYGNDL